MIFSFACSVTFPHQLPYIVSHHGFVPPALIALFHHLEVLVKPVTMLFAYIPPVIPKEIQLRMQKMQLQGHAADQVQKFPYVGKFMHLIYRVFNGSGYFTLPSIEHCPVHLHTRPAPSVYTAFLLMPCQLRFEPATMVSQLF